ncbi:MAG TPA: Rieske 2Fe-2S domain-containing protein [Rhodospirillaceae bacterium]|nr:Rieske 2Fe-2S domain-containing protein [Rhodospirillaceae bacterium]
MTLAPVLHLQEHLVDGETRWTGRAVLEGRIWRDLLVLEVAGQLIGVRNRCPHRDMSLLMGRLDSVEGTLECPSHGWVLPLLGSELKGLPVKAINGDFFLVLDEN